MGNLKRFPKNDYTLKSSSYLQEQAGIDLSVPELKPHSSLKFTAPGPIPPRKGRKLVAIAILSILGYGAYSTWNTFFRYESYGVVAANVVGVRSPIEGQIQKIEVSEGTPVSSGDFLAKVINTNDYRDLLKIEDEIEVTLSEIDAKESENRWNKGKNNDTFYEATGQLTTEEGLLAELKAKIILQKNHLARIRFLRKEGAVSQLDLDKAEADVAGTLALIAGKTNTIAAMKSRLEKSHPVIDDDGSSQIIPLEKKLSYLKNEKKRLEDKIAEGNLMSPVNGVVSEIKYHAGDRISDDSLFNIIENDSSKIILFYNPAAKVPSVGEEVEVWSPSLGKMIKTNVTAVSKDVTSPPDQIKRNFSVDEKLIKVYLKPKNVEIDSFVVGSVIKRPNAIEAITGFSQIVSLFTGNTANANPTK